HVCGLQVVGCALRPALQLAVQLRGEVDRDPHRLRPDRCRAARCCGLVLPAGGHAHHPGFPLGSGLPGAHWAPSRASNSVASWSWAVPRASTGAPKDCANASLRGTVVVSTSWPCAVSTRRAIGPEAAPDTTRLSRTLARAPSGR